MPTKLVWLFVAIALSPLRVQAASEVTYQFELPVPNTKTENEALKLGSIEIKDRQWSLTGVEEAEEYTLPAWPLTVPAKFRVEFRPDPSAAKVSYLIQDQQFSVEPGPSFARDLWPRTREMFSARESQQAPCSQVLCEKLNLRDHTTPSPLDLL